MSKVIEEAWGWLQRQLGNNASVLALFAVLLIVVGAKGRDTLAEEAAKQVAPVARQVSVVERKQDRYEQDVHEFAQDVRELYRVSPVVRRSARLERPFPVHVDDGGEP